MKVKSVAYMKDNNGTEVLIETSKVIVYYYAGNDGYTALLTRILG